MNNIEVMAFCDKYLRYDGSNTGIRGIAYYENKGMFWVRHEGEELLLVLEGDVVVYTEEYEPLALTEGDSTYFDSTMGHAVVSTSKGDALILWVCVAT